MKTKFALLVAYAIISISWPASAQPGSLDSTFGVNKNGKVTMSVVNGLVSEANSVAMQADGKIVTAGLSDNGFDASGPYNFALMRYRETGRLDKAFGNNGKVVVDFGGVDIAHAVAIQDDQKIVAAGVTENRSVKHFAITRFLQSGAPDITFGVNGKVTTDFGVNSEAYAIAIQGNQRIVVVGVTGTGLTADFALVRYLYNGTLDKSFGTSGKMITHFSDNQEAHAVAIQPDGKIVVAGYNISKGDFTVLRYLENGTPDVAFGLNGRIITHFDNYELARAYSIAIQKDGKIVLAGYVGKNTFVGWMYDFALARYQPDGLPDYTFGVNGKVVTNIRGNDFGQSMVLQPNGKIVVAGYSTTTSGSNFTLARYTVHGTLDKIFGGTGNVVTDFGGVNTFGRSVTLQQDGKIVVAGKGTSATDYFAIARYNGDNTAPSISSNDDIADLRKESNTAPNISLSPNPARDILFVSGLSSSTKTITVVDRAGLTLQRIITTGNNHTFNVGQLHRGIYYVKINEGTKTTTLKFIKE